MPKWTKTADELPSDYEADDRLLLIVAERPDQYSHIAPRLVILEATENGWYSPDSMYAGYTPADGILWAWEEDVADVARVACPGVFSLENHDA